MESTNQRAEHGMSTKQVCWRRRGRGGEGGDGDQKSSYMFVDLETPVKRPSRNVPLDIRFWSLDEWVWAGNIT